MDFLAIIACFILTFCVADTTVPNGIWYFKKVGVGNIPLSMTIDHRLIVGGADENMWVNGLHPGYGAISVYTFATNGKILMGVDKTHLDQIVAFLDVPDQHNRFSINVNQLEYDNVGTFFECTSKQISITLSQNCPTSGSIFMSCR
ncbi:hypothetical protein NEOLI_005382 [Neolecta irregularis DAH-3]|uniref:Uncharacterized protein n=1 Tax=Neolecta irregularis (strain DAH-3) TaxID=1198029 RepID=A0A1U7LKE9_NEOID|nr:hypothetical protein NEOLI_005382 [Neolecta irregularis DAH-3]|eukprot:OLL23119.1 hypothetical protein NEOLI_005382 [Neolecta irregularis DAH-3]